MKKRVFLYAYDNLNLGDDLFVHTIVKRYPNVKFYIWTDKRSEKTFGALHNLKVLDKDSRIVKNLAKIRPSFAARYKSLFEKRCNAVVYIGGSLFIEYDNWKTILSWWEYEANTYPFFVIGANFGPYKNEAYKEKLSAIFSNMKDVCFRDQYSYKHFEDISNVRFAPDILFSYDVPKVKSTKKQVFISVINCEEKDEGTNQLAMYDNTYIATITKVIIQYLNEGYSIILSSFCKGEGDEKAIEKVLNHLKNNSLKDCIDVVNYDGTNVEQLIRTIAESEIVIASRFHAAILGFVSDKPVFPIVYSDKTIHVLEDCGFKGMYMDVRKLENKELYLLEQNLQMQKISCLSMLKNDSMKHFYKLDELMKG